MYILRLVMLSAILAIVWAGCSDEPDPSAEPGDDSQEAKSSPSMLETAEPRLVVSPSAGSGASSAAIDEYAVGCVDALSAGQSAIDPESGFTYRQWSNGFAASIKAWEQIDPPEEIADWHNSVLASQKATKELVDGYPGSVDDLILDDDEFLLGMFEELAEYGFAQEQAWMNMSSDVRDRLVAAGCYDEGGTGGTVEVDDEKCDRLLDDLTVSGSGGTVSPEAARYRCIFNEATTHSGSSTLDDDVLVTVVDQPVGFEFSGEDEDTPADVKARLYPRLDGNDFVHVSGIQEGDAWHAELDHLESVDLGAVREASHSFTSGLGDYTLVVRASWRGDVEATVFYAIHIRMDLGPVSNLRYAWEGGGSSIRVTWDAVEGADHYTVYLGASGCKAGGDGFGLWCEELASDVVETTYVHVDANTLWRPNNYYWVVACSGDWCSEVNSENPAQPIEERPDAPANVRFAIEGASIRVVWDAVEDADSYNVYYDRRLLTTAVVGTDFVHTEPDYGYYEYRVSACNRGGCSDVDVENPAKPFENRPSVPANARTVVEGSSIRVSWDPVEGAGYYKIYHDDARADSPQGCHLSLAGGVFLCNELAANVDDVTYLHADPDLGLNNFYWVVACNRGGCSDIDEENPARQMGSESSGPTTQRVDPSPTPEPTATMTPSDAPETTPTPTHTPKPTPTTEVSPEKEPIATSEPMPTPTPTATAIPEETRLSAPSNVRFAIEGASIRVIWDAVEGADHYTVYHGVSPFDSPPPCRQARDGRVLLCEALAMNVEDVVYVHTEPDSGRNDFYWVVACNEGGCSEFDPENPAKPFEERPISPANLRTVVEGSSIRVGWDPVEGAGSYKLYHGESPFDSPLSCRLSLGSVVGFCEELAADVEEASYLHAEPDLGLNNIYWVVACNKGGCSDIDSENPVRQEKSNTQ